MNRSLLKIILTVVASNPAFADGSTNASKPVRRFDPDTDVAVLPQFSPDSTSVEDSTLPVGRSGSDEDGMVNLSGKIRKEYAYDVLLADLKRSIICSPYSVIISVGVLLFAVGDYTTERRLLTAAGLDSMTQSQKYFKELGKATCSGNMDECVQASRFLVRKDKEIDTQFINISKFVFGDVITRINMTSMTDTAEWINNWAFSTTGQRIHKLIEPDDLDPSYDAMIFDAFHYEASWRASFKDSMKRPFFGADTIKNITFMHDKGYYMYGTNINMDAQFLQIPFKKKDSYMLIVLPGIRSSVSILLNQLKRDPSQINRSTLKITPCEVYFPNINIETRHINMKDIFTRMGLRELFAAGAGLKDLVKGERVNIDVARQIAALTISSPILSIKSHKPSTEKKFLKFDINRPFFFYVVSSKEQLLVGTYAGPRK